MNKTFGKYVLILGLSLVLLITACSPKEDEEPATEDKEDDVAVVEVEEEEEIDQEEEPEAADESLLVTDAPPAPTNLAELIAYPVGPFAGRDYEENAEEIEKVLNGFPKLTSEEPTEEEVQAYWEMILPLFAEDYPDPVNIVKKWEAFSFGSPESDDPRLQFKENYNVEIILDASGSMGAYVGSKTRMEVAKDAIREFAQGLPEEANVGLRVYGHEGSSSDADKELSCNSNELVYDIQSYDEKALNESMDKFKPAGWTPLAEAITLAMEDLREYNGEQNTNIIYIVSDGIETCDGDPVKAAENLAKSDITPIVNVIGLDVNSEGQEQLKDIADASDGTYSLVKNQDQLMDEFQRSRDMANAWLKWKLDAIGEVRETSVERMEMIRGLRGDWADGWQREYSNFHDAFRYLEANGNISREVSSALFDLRGERIDLITDNLDQIWDDLYALKEKQINEAREMIEEQYNKNTED